MADGAPVTREELEALEARVRALEDAHWRARPAATAAAPAFAPAAPTPVAMAPPVAPRPSPSPAPARAPTRSVETMLGKQFAPRIGGALVFLAAIFFLGVAIDRGWIGPLAQLGVAVAGAAGLLAVAALLSSRKGYGTYPQVLEATAMCVLYVTAFVAHAVPYYQRETGLDELGSGILMALVAGLTVALALWRDARVIVGLGYTLAFVTAGLGWGVLPTLTLTYVVILGTSLAVLVARKKWLLEGTAGTLATGGFLVSLAVRANETGDPNGWVVAGLALLPAAAFVWLSLARPPTPTPKGAATARALLDDAGLLPFLAFITLAWTAIVTVLPFDDRVAAGGVLLGWTAIAAALAFAARERATNVAAAYGAGAVVLYVAAAPALWSQVAAHEFAVTATYAAGALALGLLMLARRSLGVWYGALALAGIAAFRAVFLEQRLLFAPRAGAEALGSWEAWGIFVLMSGAIVAILALSPEGTPRTSRRVAFGMSVVFLAIWAWALFHTPFLTTLYLIVAGAAFAALALASRTGGNLARDALPAALALLAVAALKTATYDVHSAQPPMEPSLAGIETALVAALLLALHHVSALRPRLRSTSDAQLLAAALIGGSAAVIASYIFAYAEGAAASVLLGVLGVAYLAAGFAMRRDAMYRYVGFSVLGFVLLRVFTVDLSEADMAVRALVFLVLGAILLGVGFAYARVARKPDAPPAPSAEFERLPPPP